MAISELKRARTEETFSVDGKFLRDETREAIRSYFMPFAGIYAAAVGKDVRVVGSKGMRAHKKSVERCAKRKKR